MITKLDAAVALGFNATLRQNKLYFDVDNPPSEVEIQNKLAEHEALEPMRLLRQQRNQLLSNTDWWVLPDRTVTQAQLDYRQALRDLPQYSSPELDENGNLINVNWPEKPQ